MNAREQVREFIAKMLQERGQSVDFVDEEDLILSGRLDSIAVIELVVFLENTFNMKLLAHKFKAEDLGTPAKIFELVEAQA